METEYRRSARNSRAPKIDYKEADEKDLFSKRQHPHRSAPASTNNRSSCSNKRLTMAPHPPTSEASPNASFLQIMEKLNGLESRFDKFESRIISVETKITDIEKQLKESLAQQLDQVRTEMQTTKNEVNLEITNFKEEITNQFATKLNEERKIKNELQLKIENIEHSLATNQANALKSNLIFSGPAVPRYSPGENTIQVAYDLIKDCCKLNQKNDDIIAAKRFGKPPSGGEIDKRKLHVVLSNPDLKWDIIQQCITLRNSEAKDLYINEELTESVQEMFYHLRKIRKANPNKIKSVNTRHSRIRIKKSSVGAPVIILTRKDFNEFLRANELTNPLEN